MNHHDLSFLGSGSCRDEGAAVPAFALEDVAKLALLRVRPPVVHKFLVHIPGKNLLPCHIYACIPSPVSDTLHLIYELLIYPVDEQFLSYFNEELPPHPSVPVGEILYAPQYLLEFGRS